MPESDHGFKIIARSAGRSLARVAGLDCLTWEPVESTLQTTTERLADRVFRTGRGRNRYLVYMEFYTYWDRHAPWNLLAKTGLLSETERLPVVPLVFVLKPRGYRSQNGTVQLSANGQPAQQLWFHEVPLWELTPEPWWDMVSGLMALYPLCHHGERPKQAMRHAVQAIEALEPTPIARADMLTYLGIFGKLAYPNLDIIRMIGREKMKESKFFDDVKMMVREEERVNAHHEALIEVVESRFGSPTAQRLTSSVVRVEDANRLRQLLRIAIQCHSVAELEAELGG